MDRKRAKSRGQSPNKRSQKSTQRLSQGTRNSSMDSLRGLAILLMIVDHIANFWFIVRIEPTSIRMLTRLSMPLFAILMGYFLVRKPEIHWNRLLQVAAVSIAVNCFFFPIYGKLEILASLLVCYWLILLPAKFSPVAVPLVLLFPFDPSAAVLDYPLTIVASCVALGQVLRYHGWKVGLACSLLISASALYIAPIAKLTVLMVPIATGLLIWGIYRPKLKVPGLDLAGRYPLTFYLVHYLIVLALRPR